MVTATGMGTELGRIAALSQRVGREESPLEHQVKRAARPIGLLVANVPEGLLPTITLALAVGVRDLARRGALVKRLSAVETLGSTSVICTDKTGTLTQNRMRVTAPARGPAAIEQVHRARIRVHVVTGDNGLTAAAIARRIGIGADEMRVVNGTELDAMTEHDLDELLGSGSEVVFARSSPEAKLRIADALRAQGQVVAMTGDGVNDAPALRRADIGVAMGRSGTDVAREAATMILTDDNFAAIAAAVEAGRRVYDNVRKFICYIFTHAVPEVMPFLIFALAGGLVPLPLTVMQILAIDLGTDTLPALALSREPAEPGLMDRPPRPRRQGVISAGMLARAWGFLGVISATLVMAGFFLTLRHAGWHPGAPTGPGTPLNEAYRQATTVTWLGIVACQVGTAFAVRTDHASLRQVGVFSNKLLLGAIAVALAFAAALVYLPAMHGLFGTASLSPGQLAIVAPFP